jgi:GNAT superfamily N-acetyltransferase
LRHDASANDVDTIVHRHGALYAAEHGFDVTFEDYVRAPLAEAVRRSAARERLWIAEDAAGRFLGCIAIVEAAPDVAQLRWYLVEPHARRNGLGTRLLEEAVLFALDQGYRSVTLWTVRALAAAAARYRAAGFRRVEQVPGRRWGRDVTEERWQRLLG